MRKPIFKKKLLEKILKVNSGTLDTFLLSNFFETRERKKTFRFNKETKILRWRISNLLSKLQIEGLVIRIGPKKKSIWEITKKGKNWLQTEAATIDLPKPDGIIRLVIFDISEKEKYKRNWIRSELVSLNYEILQKSVWVGYHPLPKEFIEKLDDLKLQDCVHIFSVKETGTLKSKNK